MKCAYIVVGLQFGDEGKGMTVDTLCRNLSAGLVVRYSGGYQAAHNVTHPNGAHHTFRQIGSGGFYGIPTHLGPEFIFCPLNLKIEQRKLLTTLDQHDMRCHRTDYEATRISVDPECLVATPYARAMNLLSMTDGSCGCGIGFTRQYWLQYGMDALRVVDLSDPIQFRSKLRLQRHRVKLQLASMPMSNTVLKVAEKVDSIDDLAYMCKCLRTEYDTCGLLEAMLGTNGGPIVCEGSQGVLLDEYCGFHPHTTWSRTTSQPARELLREAGIAADQTTTVGCVRAFTTRHGNGPLPGEDDGLKSILQDPHNSDTTNAGRFRWAPFNMPLFRYALACNPVDVLSVSWLDRFNGWTVTDHPESYQVNPMDRLSSENTNLASQVQRVLHEHMSLSTFLSNLSAIRPIAITGHGSTSDQYTFDRQLL